MGVMLISRTCAMLATCRCTLSTKERKVLPGKRRKEEARRSDTVSHAASLYICHPRLPLKRADELPAPGLHELGYCEWNGEGGKATKLSSVSKISSRSPLQTNAQGAPRDYERFSTAFAVLLAQSGALCRPSNLPANLNTTKIETLKLGCPLFGQSGCCLV